MTYQLHMNKHVCLITKYMFRSDKYTFQRYLCESVDLTFNGLWSYYYMYLYFENQWAIHKGHFLDS